MHKKKPAKAGNDFVTQAEKLWFIWHCVLEV